MTPLRRIRRRSSAAAQKRENDRTVRHMESYYRDLNYNPATIEDEAEQTFQIAQRLNKRKRGLRNVKLTGVEN